MVKMVRTLRHARKNHVCTGCGQVIAADTDYCQLDLPGSGLGAMKHPDRAHDNEKCIALVEKKYRRNE